ncbi:MAG: PQQ-dependent sugar dehydrogenase [Halieaceae bacterium]|jgi:glucose/arabinose dehydrogenase|nr:PQQ-dependent sugar dehydrogenase [Halieaceae bacterium]
MSKNVFLIFFTCVLVTACAKAEVSKPEKISPAAPKSQVGPQCFDKKDRRPGQPLPYCGDLPTLAALNIREAELELVIGKLKKPWALEFLDDDTALVTEFGGRLMKVDLGTKNVEPVSGVVGVSTGGGQRGLLDVAVHPRFSSNQLIYYSYARKSPDQDAYTTALARARLVGSELRDVEEIFLALPYAGNSSNFGGAILFDDKGFLFFSTGDRAMASRAQDPKALNGKIVRLNDDGSIPADNPFVGDDRFHPAIYAYGVRNPQGLVQDKETGIIYETEHGPMGGDEVNIVEAGKNYGWPTISHGMKYGYQPTGEGAAKAGMEQPFFFYLPSLAISPIEVYRGEMFPEWEGDLLVGALAGRTISKLHLTQGRIQSESRMLSEVRERVRDIKVASDGSIFVLGQSGKLFRLSRTIASAAPLKVGERSGSDIYESVCSACHSRAVTGVPQLGVASDWVMQRAKPKPELMKNVVSGINDMPEKGNCDDCTDAELARAVDYMLESLEPKR